MNHEPQHVTSKRAKYIHAYTQTQTESEFVCEQYYSENEPKDIFNKLQILIISSIKNEKQILTNNMCDFQLQNAKDFLNLRKKQFNVNQSSRNLYFEQLDIETVQKYNQLALESHSETEQIKILLSNQFNAIKSLYDDHAEALYDLHNEQSEALLNFNKTQCEAFKEFDIKQREPKFIKNFLGDQIIAKKKFHCIQANNILKLQYEHNKVLWELKYEHNKALSSLNLNFNEETKILIDAIEELQTIYNKNIQKLELEQMKETHILQFEQSKITCEYNLQYVKNVESLQIQLLQPDKTMTYLKYIKKFVKKIIIKNKVFDNDKLTQENFDLLIREILDNDQHQVKLCDYLDDDEINNVYNKYAKYNLIVQIVIFLHWTKELNLKLNFNLITSCLKESENNSYLKYLKLVFPNLDNLKNLIQ